MSRHVTSWIGCAALPLLVLGGCAQIDPLTKEGIWRPTGANDANLRAMVAVPSDLAYGRAARTSDGRVAAQAVERLRTGRVYPLQDFGTSKIGGGGTSAATPAAGQSDQ
jgi:type IV pilus biogenesis protein CpaD/CtpE